MSQRRPALLLALAFALAASFLLPRGAALESGAALRDGAEASRRLISKRAPAKTRYESESIKASGGLGDCRPYHHGAWRNCDRRGHCTPDHAPAARILAHPTSVFVSPQ